MIDEIHKDNLFKEYINAILNQKEGVEHEDLWEIAEQAYILGHLHGRIEALTN